MTDKTIKEQIDALKSVTAKALQSKAASTRLLANLAKFSALTKQTNSSKKGK